MTHVVHVVCWSPGLHRTGEAILLGFLYHVWNICLLKLFVLDVLCWWFDLYTNMNIKPAEMIFDKPPPQKILHAFKIIEIVK